MFSLPPSLLSLNLLSLAKCAHKPLVSQVTCAKFLLTFAHAQSLAGLRNSRKEGVQQDDFFSENK